METDTPRIIQLPKIIDDRGNLTFLEGMNHIPFNIERAYWIYDVPGGEIRGGHAFKNLYEFIIAISGSFDVILNNGELDLVFHLNRSYFGLFVPKMYWRQVENFSTNSLCMILTSDDYKESEYIRDFSLFKNLRNG